MKALVVYDSAYGNTKSVAEAIAGSPGELTGVKAAAFDTRVRMFIHGDAAKKMTRALRAAGAHIIAEPMPFYVAGSEGPLRSGEMEKAEGRGRTLLTTLKN